MIAMNETNKSTPNSIQRAERVLKDAEVQLKELISEAALDGNYDVLDQLKDWAQRIKSFYEYTDLGSPKTTVAKAHETRIASETLRETKRSPSKRKPTRPAGYPRFSIDGNSLVKSSWSKKQKDEYHHKADRKVAEQLVGALLSRGKNREIISTDQLFPLSDGGKDFPDYQSYSCLLWLKTIGLVRHLGREGYQIRDPDSFEAEFEQHWNELPAFEDQ